MAGGVHLIKLAVGVDDVAHLRALQAARLKRNGEVAHVTRNRPRRESDLLDGGSIYWVIKGFVRARQSILAVRSVPDDEGKFMCALVFDPVLVETSPTPFRAFQGWRYLDPLRAPPDAAGTAIGDLPPALSEELRTLGVL